jgi:hypothetical protein
MFAGRIANLPLFGPDLALAGDAALQLRLNFRAASLLKRVDASRNESRERDCEQDRQGPHPLILGMKLSKANRQN